MIPAHILKFSNLAPTAYFQTKLRLMLLFRRYTKFRLWISGRKQVLIVFFFTALSLIPVMKSSAIDVINNLSFDFYSQEQGLSNNQIHCVLNHEELKNGDVSLEYVSKLMNRRYTDNTTFRKILQSIWYQINSGQEVFVIGEILDDKTVKGGTGWGAEFSKICNKPLHVFDQKRNKWYIWNKLEWVERKKGDEPVISHVHFTGTGTRFIEENGKKAIKDLFARSFSQ